MESISNKYKILIRLSSAMVFLYSIGVIIYAWLLEYGIANPHVTGHLPIAKDAAFCFILIVCSLVFRINYKTSSIKLISKFLSIATILIAVTSIFQNLWGELYKKLLPFLSSNITFGMSLQTAFCFICLGLALLFIDSWKHKRIVQALLHLTSSIAFIVIMGHLLQIPELYKFTFFSAMAIYSAICFILVSMAASLVHPTVGLTGLLLGKKSGSVMARRLTIRICGVMLLATYLLILCHRHRWFGLDYALAVFSITFIMLTLFFIYKTSAVLNKIERNKEIALSNFTAVFESSPNAVIIADRRGRISLVNKMGSALFGYESAQLIGQNLDIIVPERFRKAHNDKQPNFFKNPQKGILTNSMISTRQGKTVQNSLLK